MLMLTPTPAVPTSADYSASAAKAFTERWICMGCAYTTRMKPGGGIHGATCPDCGATSWHYTVKPVPVV